jgi:hypothetical protein
MCSIIRLAGTGIREQFAPLHDPRLHKATTISATVMMASLQRFISSCPNASLLLRPWWHRETSPSCYAPWFSFLVLAVLNRSHPAQLSLPELHSPTLGLAPEVLTENSLIQPSGAENTNEDLESAFFSTLRSSNFLPLAIHRSWSQGARILQSTSQGRHIPSFQKTSGIEPSSGLLGQGARPYFWRSWIARASYWSW